MATLTRRGLLKQTSLGAAAAGALLAVPALTSAQAAPVAPVARTLPTLNEPLAAFVRDAASGEITLLIGTREFTVHDPELLRRLVQAAR